MVTHSFGSHAWSCHCLTLAFESEYSCSGVCECDYATNSLISCFKLLLFCGHPLFFGQYLLYYHSPHRNVLQLKQHWRQVWKLGSQNKWGYRLSLLNSSIRTLGSQPALLQVVSWCFTPSTVISGRYFRWNWKTVPQSQHWQLMVMGPWAWEWEWVSHFTFCRMSAPSS